MKKPTFAPWPSFDQEIVKAVSNILRSGRVSQWTGPNVYAFEKEYAHMEVNTVDGVKVDMPEGWVHLRKSNTEPIIRLYAEANSPEEAERIALEAKKSIDKLLK